MKETKIGKCLSMMRRGAVAIFALLCVGSLWGEEGDGSTKTVAFDGGYKIFGLGENRNETAVVFTRTGLSTWTVPIDIKNAQFLVVGGGGGDLLHQFFGHFLDHFFRDLFGDLSDHFLIL